MRRRNGNSAAGAGCSGGGGAKISPIMIIWDRLPRLFACAPPGGAARAEPVEDAPSERDGGGARARNSASTLRLLPISRAGRDERLSSTSSVRRGKVCV